MYWREVYMDKKEQALIACDNVLNGIEDDTISSSSALLQCLKIARLTNNQEATIWLQYEYGGYPRGEDGYILHDAWEVAYANGRGYMENGKPHIFLELAAELEEKIRANQKAISNFTTQGTSLEGEHAYIAMNSLLSTVNKSTSTLLSDISRFQKRLSVLRSCYYDYALKAQINLGFGNVATTIFSEYRNRVDSLLSSLSKETILKLQAIEDKINSANPELYSQALTTCRRLFQCVADELFKKHLPNYQGEIFKTKSGKEINISGDHYKNKLSAIIEVLEGKTMHNSIVGSNIIYLLDWIDNLVDLQCKGVHSEISKQDATRCIIQTYICLGDILNLQNL